MTRALRSGRRSDGIRRRRTDPARKVVLPTAKRAKKTAGPSAPPVMTRAPVTGFSKTSVRRSSKTRRRYDVALDIPGAEVRLPSLPQVRIGWRLISFAMVALLSLALYQLWTSPAYKVKDAKVAGLERITSNDVSAVLGIAEQPIFTIDPHRLEEDLKTAFPEFSQVSVVVALPDVVEVKVVERQAVITWRQNGRTELVDAQGFAFPVRNEAAGLPAVIVEAASTPSRLGPRTIDPPAVDPSVQDLSNPGAPVPVARDLLAPEMVSAILALAEQAPQNTPLLYNQVHGLGWKDGRGWEVYFGDVTDIEMKLSVYKAIVKELQADEVQPALISVEFVHSPYYRVEQ